MRPEENFASPGEQGKLRRSESLFVLSPTVFQSGDRSKQTSQRRRRLQMATSPVHLWWIVAEALESGNVDVSVFGAAFQRCGQGRWWDALLEVRRLQQQCNLHLRPTQVSILLKALARSVRDEDGFGAVPGRQEQVVQLGKEVWSECNEHNVITFGAALNLCVAAPEIEGLEWAEDLWRQIEELGIERTPPIFTAFAQVSAVHGITSRVNELLAQASRGQWKADAITLGALVNTYAEQWDWRSVEEIWKTCTQDMKIRPNEIAVTARSKAHLLAGRPSFASDVIDEVVLAGIETAPVAEMHVQALLVVHHSDLKRDSWNRLLEAVRHGEPVVAEATLHQQRTWAKMKEMVEALHAQPSHVRLHDLLVEWKAARSAMAQWPNYEAGSAYLAEHE